MYSVSNILSTKRILIIVSIAVLVKLSIPIAVNEIPAIWTVVLSWLKPPYLYIVINFIIITIAASSRFHVAAPESSELVKVISTPDHHPAPTDHDVFASTTTLTAQHQDMLIVEKPTNAEIHHEEKEIDIVDEESHRDEVVNDDQEVPIIMRRAHEDDSSVAVAAADDEKSTLLLGPSDDAPPTQEIISEDVLTELTATLLPVREKPLVSTRFGHRKPSKTIPHDQAAVAGSVRALRVARPKKQETLESTWKMVTEGRHMPLTRHLKTKSERWLEHVTPDVAAGHVPLKSETFKERTTNQSRIRKEPSLGQDELNRRVEAFIKKFNEDMRMQRQESLNRFMEMINRGV